MRSCSTNGGSGNKVFFTSSVPNLCCPAVPENFCFPCSIKYGDLTKRNKYLGNIVRLMGRKICNSVVPAPYSFCKLENTTDFRFWKHGVILAKPTSPFWKCVNPLLTSFQGRVAAEKWLLWPSAIAFIYTNETSKLSGKSCRGLIMTAFSDLVQHQESGISKGKSSSRTGSFAPTFS